MGQQTGRKTFTENLQPTAQPEETRACGVRRCRARYTAGLHERRDAWQHCGGSSTAARQRAQVPDITDVRPAAREGHSQGWHDVLTRLASALQACFRRVRAGQTPGSPRFHGATR